MQERQTKYFQSALAYMRSAGHATNAEILQRLRREYPDLSATTVHRLTSRLVVRGKLASAPPSPDNAARFDANLTPHDHFECVHCGCLRDVILPPAILEPLQSALGNCRLSGRLNVQGTCAKCLAKEKE